MKIKSKCNHLWQDGGDSNYHSDGYMTHYAVCAWCSIRRRQTVCVAVGGPDTIGTVIATSYGSAS